MQHPKKNIAIVNQLEKDGVIFIDKDNTYISDNVVIGAGTVIYPFVTIWNGVKIKNNCIIQSHTLITDNVQIFDNVLIGPFSFIRKNVTIGTNSSIGPHCEITRSIIGANCVIGHKNYLGDATLYDGVKFGAGAIIANTDWQNAYKTSIGSNSLIGVNSCIIAPKSIGENVIIAAGSTITCNVEDNHLAIARSQQINKVRKK